MMWCFISMLVFVLMQVGKTPTETMDMMKDANRSSNEVSKGQHWEKTEMNSERWDSSASELSDGERPYNDCEVKSDERDCPLLVCDPTTFTCPFRSFFAISPSRTICRGCNVCIKPGSTVYSTGCPQLACREDLTQGACRQPWVRNSWIDYHGRQCKTCEALLCNL